MRTEKPCNLREILDMIKRNPYLFFGVKSLDSIFFFISGYYLRAELENSEYTDCLDGFEEFVHSHYEDMSTRNWHGLIVHETRTQEDAVDRFFELIEMFFGLTERDNGSR